MNKDGKKALSALPEFISVHCLHPISFLPLFHLKTLYCLLYPTTDQPPHYSEKAFYMYTIIFNIMLRS